MPPLSPNLTLDEANRIIAGAIAKAQELKVKIAVAVCDPGGRLLAFQRMDGAFYGTVYGSQGKAAASAAFARPSGDLQERAATPIISGIIRADGDRIIPSQGAMPIFRDGVLIGACGIGGAAPQQDEECAKAGVSLLS